MKAREIVEAEAGSAREFFKKLNPNTPSAILKVGLDAIKLEYSTGDLTALTMDQLFGIYTEAADRRTGSLHEEGTTDGRPYCAVCGFVDEGNPDPEYHPEFYLDQLK